MARIIDGSKLESIKKSLIELIIKEGATNASISKVAKRAKVSAGYLYSHYQSKEELIIAIYMELFEEVGEQLVQEINEGDCLKDVLKSFYTKLVVQVKNDENKVLFLLKMITDYSNEVTEDMRSKLNEFITLLKNKFDTEIADNIEFEHIYLQVLVNALLFINIRKKGVLKKSAITANDIDLLTKITIKSLK